MDNKIKKPSKKKLYNSIVGTGLVALCCFTPILVVGVGIIGLGVLAPYLDYFLFPALGVLIVLTIWFYVKYKKECKECDLKNVTSDKINK